MNKFDSVVEEAFKDLVGGISSAFNVAKGAYTTDIRNLPSFAQGLLQKSQDAQKELPKQLEQKKSQLKFVTTDTARKALQELKNLNSTITTQASTAKIFSPTAVIMEKVGTLEGIMGEIIDVQDPLINLFNLQLNSEEVKPFNVDIKKLISQNGTFWVKITTPRTTNESFDNIINYQNQIINEVVNQDLKYATWFIVESDNDAYLNKFKITNIENKPNLDLGVSFRVNDNREKPTGLLQVGQGTFYPRWYFLNDFTEKKGPLGIKEPEKNKNYSGDVKIT